MMSTFKVNELHGKVINYDQIKNIPNRKAFLNKDIYDDVDISINQLEPLLFMPNDLAELTNLQDKKFDKPVYKIVLFGVLLDGRKATVVISGISPFVDVLMPHNINSEFAIEPNITIESESKELYEDTSRINALDLYEKLKRQKDTCPIKFELVSGKYFKTYQKDKSMFARFHFNTAKSRRNAIDYIRNNNYETANDDTSCYYRVVCRNMLTSFSSWVVLTDYTIRKYSAIRDMVFDVNIKNYKLCNQDITKDIRLSKDNTLTCCWDIETYSPDGQLPRPEFEDHKMFMIGITYQWYHSNDQLLRVCLVDHPCLPRPNFLTVVCETEKKLIKAFGKLTYKMKPDIIEGFNDSDYDWNWLIKRAKIYKGTLSFLATCFDSTIPQVWERKCDDDSIMQYNFKKERIKLESDSYADGYSLVFPGYINIDVRTVFRQIYPVSEKSSLNYYLSLNNLSGKKDMPYLEMFATYKEFNELIVYRTQLKHILLQKIILTEKLECIIVFDIICEYLHGDSYYKLCDKMSEIADYCVIDSQRCHELMRIRSVIMDRREVAKLSYTSVFDALYRANGMKVRNLVIAKGQTISLKFSNIAKMRNLEEGKYPGAYVVPPIKGLVKSKLSMKERIELSNTIGSLYKEWGEVTDTEYSYYKHIIDIVGICVVGDELSKLKSTYNGEKLLRKCFLDFIQEPTGRPITGLDFSSLYPSLMMTYNLSPEYIVTDLNTAKKLHEEGHNLYKIKFLYNGRNVRGWSIRHDNKIDEKSSDCKFGIYPMILKQLFDTRKLMKKELHKWEIEKEQMDTEHNTQNPDQYDNICFNVNYLNSKQNALKVFMNTFYGESGNKNSPFFVLQLAGAITTAGQYNIKLIQQYVESIKCKVMYGDTDSLYISMPEDNFGDLDKLYYTDKISKLEYWEDLVNITFKVIQPLNEKVNVVLYNDNGTQFLKMAYEEVLFPVAYLAKKKYYGIPHISKPNYQPKNLFIRGIDVKKRGVSNFLKKCCMSIMWDSVSYSNLYELVELVLRKIDSIYSTKWEFIDFIMTDVFKPLKHNIKIHTFVNRMVDVGINVKPYERFDYVIVKKNPYKYDHRGRKHDLSIGDKMEYASTASENNLDIDLDYYMKGSVNGQLSRLITYVGEFHVEPNSSDSDDLKVAEDKIYNNACKYIENYCTKYYTTYKSKGRIYQKVFKLANSAIINKVNDVYPKEIVKLLNSNYDTENIEEWINHKSEQQAILDTKKYGNIYIENRLNDLVGIDRTKKLIELQNIYYANKKNNLLNIREKTYMDRKLSLNQQLGNNINGMIKLLNHQTQIVINISDTIKDMINIDNMYNDANILVPDFADHVELPNIILNNDMINEKASSEFQRLIDEPDYHTVLCKLRCLYINMLSNYSYIHKTRSIVEYLKTCRDNKIGVILKPSNFNVYKYIKNNVDDIINIMTTSV